MPQGRQGASQPPQRARRSDSAGKTVHKRATGQGVGTRPAQGGALSGASLRNVSQDGRTFAAQSGRTTATQSVRAPKAQRDRAQTTRSAAPSRTSQASRISQAPRTASRSASSGRASTLQAPRGGQTNARAAKHSPRKLLIAGAAIAAIALIAFAVVTVRSYLPAPFGTAPIVYSEEEQLQMRLTQASGKLAGATEETDGNGIVHGTTESGINYLLWGRGQMGEGGVTDKVTLCAVGDQIGTDQVLELTDSFAGTVGDGEYDFTPFYQEVAPFIQQYDLRYINQETVMAGTEIYGYGGWPSFNTPAAAADAIDQVGFNLVNVATNHVLDYDTYGAQKSLDEWENHPQQIVAGSYRSQEDRETVRMIERNGTTFAFLAFCYGDNYYQTDLPDTWNLCGFDKDMMKADIQRAQEVADVVIVSMHWGTEYQSEPNSQELEYAQYLADLDVDLVLGTHAHISQAVKYVTGESGNTIPVVYGLSDFISGWSITDYIVSGVFTCDFVRVFDNNTADSADEGAQQKTGNYLLEAPWHIEIENLAWYPTIEWQSDGKDYVRFVADMDRETTNANQLTPDVEDDYQYIRDFVNSLGYEIPVML